MPELPIDQNTLHKWNLPFSKRPDQILLDHHLEFELDNARFQLSELLMDFCNMFLLFHEIGHICCGHTRGQHTYFNKEVCIEFFDWDDWLFRGRYLRRSWEIDADAFKGDCGKITGVLIAALHVMFTYVAANNHALRKPAGP